MDYDKLDKILIGLENKLDIKQISKNACTSVSEVKRIKNLRIKSQHKRRNPMIPKIGLRTPGFDWRSPVQLGWFFKSGYSLYWFIKFPIDNIWLTTV